MAPETFESVEQLLASKSTDAPVFCHHPRAYRSIARRFVEGFPGKVLYAVKANPAPAVLQALVQGGIGSFDTASIAEIALAREVLPDADCSFNHPVKARADIALAYAQWGIRDFVVDHADELRKLFDQTGPDVVVQVRVAAPNPDATISFNAKFGADPQDAVRLLRAVSERGATAAVSTHIGYQTLAPHAFAGAVRLLAEVAAASGVRPAYINMGGGFPSVLMPAGMTLEDFFQAVAQAHAALPDLSAVPLRCEPGSALAAPGGSVLTQVLLVKRDAVYVNDGIYGALAEVPHTRKQPPTRVLARDGKQRSGAERAYTVFGPTCDSVDTLGVPFVLPGDIREGDWLHIRMMGAYSQTLITDFNGLGRHEFAQIDDEF
jgi:ornithine decarboxylase